MVYNADGKLVNPRFGSYHVYCNNKMPKLETIFADGRATGPYGTKSVAEISMDGIAPAMADAIHDATGVWIREVPFTPEQVQQALRASEGSNS